VDAFRSIYERYHGDVYRFALFLTGDPARAEDLAADTFVRAWTARNRLRQETVKAYLLTITRNLYRDQCRAHRSSVNVDDVELVDRGPAVDAQVERRLTLSHVRRLLRGVRQADRRALLLYVVEGMSYSTTCCQPTSPAKPAMTRES
jgi:RNA polymerase sigma-70 factor (ECF subfamily)